MQPQALVGIAMSELSIVALRSSIKNHRLTLSKLPALGMLHVVVANAKKNNIVR
jgi:hypothetical protein